MRKFLQLMPLLGIMIMCAMPSFAQEKIVTGKVVGQTNQPLTGATVRVRGTNRIVQTDGSGSFSIKVNKGETLDVTHVGYDGFALKIGESNNVSVSLKQSDNTLGEVTVVMDIKRNPRELGYSAQKITGNEVAGTQRENFINSLQGRVAGLTINPTTGMAGASSQIILRGFNSLSLGNQPLFVVDGIILDNSTLNETSNGGTGIGLASDRPNRNNDYTNRIADLNPSDIESITVLKGPEATALYGSQAGSGAIIITTKKAQPKKISVSYDNSFRFQKLTRKFELNIDYGNGTNGVGSSTFSATSGAFFGPKYPAGTPHYDNVGNFFRTGFAQTHNISLDYGLKNVGFRLSGSFFDQQAVIPDNDYKKYNVKLSNTTKIGKYVEITPSIQYIYSTNDKPLRSAGGFLLALYAWPVNNDIRNFQDINGNKTSVFSTDPYAEIDNPFYTVKRNHSFDKTSRVILSTGININPFSWLSISGRFGYDTYQSEGYTFYHPLSYLTSRSQLGSLDNYWRKYYGYNHTITATAKKSLGKFTGRLMLGTMWEDFDTKMFAITGNGLVDSFSSANGMLYKNGTIVTDANFAQVVGSPTDSNITRPSTRVRLLQNNFGNYNKYQNLLLAYFGEAGVSYDNELFLSFTSRFESSSVFPPKNRNYNFPGFSFSAILSDIFPQIKGNAFSYVKLRASLAGTAKISDPYANQSVFVNNFASSNVGLIYSYGFDNNNPDLLPEKQNTYEIGTELRMLNNLLSLDAAYYNTKCTNQIMKQFRASYGTGYVLNTQNAGSLRNQGIELILTVSPLTRRDFGWNVTFNFNRTWSKVLTLPQSIGYEIYYSDTWLYQNARVGLIRNNPTTTITGFHYMRNNRGDVLINPANGLPVVEGIFTPIGDRNPTFTLGMVNNFRYKNWALSLNWDLKMGGDVFDATEQYLTYQGKSTKTSDRETPRIVKGVLNDGLQNSANPTPNTIVITPYYLQTYYTSMPDEEFMQHHVNWLRLRDITVSYNMPASKIKRFKAFKSLGFFITGNDLILLTNYRGADPAVNGNTAAAGGLGAYAFDYGSLPAPISVNFGLRAGF